MSDASKRQDETPPCPFDPDKDTASFRAWHTGFREGCRAANEIWKKAFHLGVGK
jgi:hypothetical protein